MTIIKIICGKCKIDMGEKDGQGMTGISHSLCPPCAKKTLNDADIIIKEEKNESEEKT